MRLLIPTRNRSTSLAGVLGFYARFYPQARLIIADGSTEDYKAQNAALCTKTELDIDYRPFDSEMSLFDRLLTVLSDIDDDYIVMAADDDYAILETLEMGRKRLETDPDVVCVAGYLVHIMVKTAATAGVRLDPARTIAQPTFAGRMRGFSQLPFTTTYAVARREHLIRRYEFLKDWHVPGFFDLAVGLMDLSYGKIVGLPKLGFYCTRNYVHSYFRMADEETFLNHADEGPRLIELMTERLVLIDGMDRETAHMTVKRSVNRRISALAGSPPHKQAGFKDVPPYQSKNVQQAKFHFDEMFEPGTDTRGQYLDRMTFIARNLSTTLTSSDNKGEEATYVKL